LRVGQPLRLDHGSKEDESAGGDKPLPYDYGDSVRGNQRQDLVLKKLGKGRRKLSRMVDNDADLDLILRSKRGDLNAFGDLVSKHQSLVVNFCYRMLANREDAEDIAQETFLRAFGAIRTFEPKAKFSTWLLAIAKNLTLNLLRNERRRGQHIDLTMSLDDELTVNLVAAKGPKADEALIQKERAEWVRNALQQLSDVHRSIVILREFDGMTYEEIAKIMRCRKGTVKSRLSRARDHLAAILVKRETAARYGVNVIQQGDEA